MPNALNLLSYQGQTFAVPGSGGVDIFLSQVSIWNVNCARAKAFIFYTQALIWNLEIKFMAVVIGQGNAVSPVSNWCTSFFALHQFDQQFMIYNCLKSDFEKINVKIMGEVKIT